MANRTRALKSYAGFYLLFLYGPVALLPLFSVNDATTIAFPLQGFTWRWYADMAANESLHAALWNSVMIGAGTAVISTILGTLGAMSATRYRFPGQQPLTGFIMLPLVLPEVILGIALLILLNRLGISLSLGGIMAGHVMLCTPFAMAVMTSRFEGFDRSVEEASLDLGETAWMTFWRVTFPLVWPGILASLLLTFTVSFDEFIIAFFLSGTDTTLPVFIWSQLRFPNRLPSVLALGSLILLGSFVMVTLAEWVRRQGVTQHPGPVV